MTRYRVRARKGGRSYYLALNRYADLRTAPLQWSTDRDKALRTDITSAHALACRAIVECAISVRVWVDRVTVR